MLAIINMVTNDAERERAMEIYREEYKTVFYVAKNFFREPKDAEDATHDVFEKVVKKIKRYVKNDFLQGDRMKHFLRKVTRNHCIDKLRKMTRTQSRDVSTVPAEIEISDPEFENDKSIVARICSTDEVGRLIRILDEKHFRVIYLKYWLNVKDKDIALALNISFDSVQYLHKHAIHKMRKFAEVSSNA